MMRTIRGVLLDIDSTLVDSNEAHAKAWVEALSENGHQILYETIRPLIGKGGDKLLPEVCGVDSESVEGKKIGDRRAVIFKTKYLPNLQPTLGAESLLKLLKTRGFKLAVASSAKKDELKPLLKICGAINVIASATSSDDTENSKPDPDILHASLKELGLVARQTILIGDTPYDVEAARKADVGIIGLSCGGWGAKDLKADEVYLHPADLVEKFDQSILSKEIF